MTGDFTLMGVTKPGTFEVELVGAGHEAAGGAPVETVGFTAKGKIKRSDFGFTALIGPIGDEVDLTIDCEFHKAKAVSGQRLGGPSAGRSKRETPERIAAPAFFVRAVRAAYFDSSA